ncbi:hypothetical protein [Flavobacterium collinsii]|uniref:Uncharacterized protein n=1 Tax=Flavobacterium collinsii TaxID=1114861 RepID=A0ABN7EEQ9_9FLAO|nr:hypothetical protein [Flavobacterium collinsii]CAA9195056.1 hypothetical protein FLACOL7796_00417 [Flavobacterium collinsii]
MEQVMFKLTSTLLQSIKKIIERESKKTTNQNTGLNEMLGYYGKEFITKGQAQKVVSFYDNPKNDENYNDKKKLYDEINMLTFVKNSLAHQKRVDDTKIKTFHAPMSSRSVDRLSISKTMADVRPPRPDQISEQIAHERYKIIDLMQRISIL